MNTSEDRLQHPQYSALLKSPNRRSLHRRQLTRGQIDAEQKQLLTRLGTLASTGKDLAAREAKLRAGKSWFYGRAERKLLAEYNKYPAAALCGVLRSIREA